MKEYGVYFAVLPAHPSILPSALKEICNDLAPCFDIQWTHDRASSLAHPQLSEPLSFLEISGKLVTDKDADDVEPSGNALASIVVIFDAPTDDEYDAFQY